MFLSLLMAANGLDSDKHKDESRRSLGQKRINQSLMKVHGVVNL